MMAVFGKQLPQLNTTPTRFHPEFDNNGCVGPEFQSLVSENQVSVYSRVDTTEVRRTTSSFLCRGSGESYAPGLLLAFVYDLHYELQSMIPSEAMPSAKHGFSTNLRHCVEPRMMRNPVAQNLNVFPYHVEHDTTQHDILLDMHMTHWCRPTAVGPDVVRLTTT